MTITPDQARELLGIEESGDATPLLLEARHMAQTIAGMEWQTGVHAGDEDIWA